MFGVLGLNASATSRVIKNQGGDYDEMSVSLAAETGAPGGNFNGVSAIHYDKMTLIFTLVCGSQGKTGSGADPGKLFYIFQQEGGGDSTSCFNFAVRLRRSTSGSTSTYCFNFPPRVSL